MIKSRDLGNSNVMKLFLKLLKGVIVLIYYFHTYKILLKSLFSEVKWDLAITFLGQNKYLSLHTERAFLVTDVAAHMSSKNRWFDVFGKLTGKHIWDKVFKSGLSKFCGKTAFKKFSYSTLEYFVPYKEMYLYYSCRPANCFLGNSIQ